MSDIWCWGPLHLEALTRDGAGTAYGVLLRFIDRDRHSRQWAMPYELLAGSGEALRAELLDMGLEINHRLRGRLPDYLQHRTPKEKVLCTSQTGWKGRHVFVLPGEVIGPAAAGVVFQNGARSGTRHGRSGTLDGWRDGVARLAIGNPMLMFGISCGFDGPLLEPTNQEGGGVHLVGGSSTGKTTVLEAARSAWGGPDFKRSWRATSNGIEGVAEMHTDLLLPMDEINEVDPREAGSISYMLTNGIGKSRATRTGAAREARRWRLFVLSTGERSLAATMKEGRATAKAGQRIRLLDIPADRRFGCFDELHGHASGRALSDAIKNAAKEHYGIVGREFLTRLTKDHQDFGELVEISKSIPEFMGHGGQEGRAAARFAHVAMAGELATDYGLTGWPRGAAIDAAIVAFRAWLGWRGAGDDEPRKIREALRDFIDRHGDSRFVDRDADPDLRTSQERMIRDRAGYRQSTEDGGRLYLFNAAAMKEAGVGFDHAAVVAALIDCGALEVKNDKPYQQAKIGGFNSRYYVINPDRLEV